MASAEFTVRAVGVVRNDRSDVQHTDNWADVISTVAVDERFGGDCLRGLADFSHVDVVYVFDRLDERPDYRTPRSSRGRADLPAVGVFADRGPRRPNRIGVTTCAVVSVHGRELTVRGLDAVDGTPVLDIKPAMKQFHPTDIRQPEWVDRLMAQYFDR
jgi:tRNA (adenine37-N6)-methyltransferase